MLVCVESGPEAPKDDHARYWLRRLVDNRRLLLEYCGREGGILKVDGGSA